MPTPHEDLVSYPRTAEDIILRVDTLVQEAIDTLADELREQALNRAGWEVLSATVRSGEIVARASRQLSRAVTAIVHSQRRREELGLTR